MDKNILKLVEDVKMLQMFVADVQMEVKEQGRVNWGKIEGEVTIIKSIIFDLKNDVKKYLKRFLLVTGGCVCLITLKILFGK